MIKLNAQNVRIRTLTHWIIFSIIISLIPIFCALWKFCGSHSISLIDGYAEILQYGQLALISVPILAALVGDIIISENNSNIQTIFIIGGCVLLIMFTSTIVQEFTDTTIPKDYKVTTSIVIFVSTFIIGIAAKLKK